MFKLMKLPFARNALGPHISAETMDYHYGKHHKAYVDKLNKLVQGTEYESATLEEIIAATDPGGPIFNNAAQNWNHNFFWQCLIPTNDFEGPSGKLLRAIEAKWGNLEEFQAEFSKEAAENFGSGWTWLVSSQTGLEILNTKNAENPLITGETPLLTVDVWEHAYYIDYRNERPKFLEAIWNVVNWEFVAEQYSGLSAIKNTASDAIGKAA